MHTVVGTVSVPSTVPVTPPSSWTRKMEAEHGPIRISKNAAEVLARRYLKKDGGGLESPLDMVARALVTGTSLLALTAGAGLLSVSTAGAATDPLDPPA